MKRTFLLTLILLATNAIYSQTSNENLNRQLKEMRTYFLAEDYAAFSAYTYPKVVEMMGGRENMIRATQSSMNQMKNEGFQIVDISFTDPSKFIEHKNELQCSLTQELTMKIPEGKVLATYTLIAISGDNGKNWKFMDTSGKPKATMLKYFPNLNPNIVIRPKTQEFVE